jgi:2-oxoglutarate ferredoxin oxidoreductase subunit gamma
MANRECRRRTDADAGARRPVGVRIAGRGGQGVMLAGFLLAHAGMDDGLHVVQTQSYGPEARLGAAKSDVILSPDQIAYPEVISPDVFLCLSHDAFAAYSRSVHPQALSIIDERAAHGPNTADSILLPLTATARDCGATLAANIVGLGVLVRLSGIVSERSLREALAARVAPESLNLNLRALDAGLSLAAACCPRAHDPPMAASQ